MTQRAARCAALLGFLALLDPAPASAQGTGIAFDGPFTLRADELELRTGERVYIARGNVEIEQEGRLLTADRAFFNENTHLGVATGNVEITEKGDTLQSNVLQFSTETLQGTVYEGELVAADSAYTMTGAEIEKTGEKTYSVTDGRFTTCQCPEAAGRDPWAIRAATADLEIDGYAVAKNSRFEVLDVPLLWLPWFAYPLKQKRTTGFLVPEGGRSSRAGFRIAAPFFWAVRDNVNLTLTPEYQTKRGFKPAADLEYVIGQRSYGDLYGTFIHDRDLDKDENPDENFDDNRWGAKWRHLQDLPAEFRLHVDAVGNSDNNFAFDFDDFSDYRSERLLHSRAFFARAFGPGDRFLGATGVRFADDLQSPDRDDRDDFILQRLPELHLSGLSGSVPWIPGLVASGNIDYAYFQPYRDPDDIFDRALLVNDQFYDTGNDAIPGGPREISPGVFVPTGKERNAAGLRDGADNSGDDGITELDGSFQEGEPLSDKGHRILMNPRLSYPLHWEFLHFVPEVGYHGTFYNTDDNGTDTRNLFTGKADLRTQLTRTIPWPFAGSGAEHVLEPFLSYAYISDVGQRGNPLFVPETAVPQLRLRHIDLDNLTRDPADRIEEVNSVFVGVQNRFLDPASRRELAEVALSVEYDIEESEVGTVVLQGDARPAGVNTRFHAVYDKKEDKISEGLLNFSWGSKRGDSVFLRYRYVREIPQVFEDFLGNTDRFDDFEGDFQRISQVTGGFYVKASERWAFTYAGNYSFENSLSLRNVAGVEYISRCKCWAVRFEASHNRQRGYDFAFRYQLLGLGDAKERPFGGSSNNPFSRN